MPRLRYVILFSLLSVPLGSLSAQRFDVAGISSDSAVYSFLRSLQTAVAAHDSNSVASLISFPLRVNTSTGSYMVRTKATFLGRHRKILTDGVRRAILAQVADSLFVNFQGVMIGNGEVWFGATCPAGAVTCEHLGIRAINLPSASSGQ